MGSDLYNKLTDYFKRHIARLRKASDQTSRILPFLTTYLSSLDRNAKTCQTSP